MLDPIWVCRDGRKLRVSDMTRDHVVNAIRMIQRGKRWRRGFLPRLELELEIRNLRR